MSRETSYTSGLAVAVLLILPAAGLRADHLRNVKPGEPMPPFAAKGLDGKDVASKDVAGKVLVLVYLSVQQKQSEEAMASAHKVISAIGSADLTLLYMSAEPDQASYFRQLRDRLMAHESFAFDAGRQYYGKLGLIAFPTTVITSRDGKLLHVISSWTRDYAHQLELYCRHALGEFNAAELAKRLAAKPKEKDEARARAERHRTTAAILKEKGMAASAIQELERAVATDPTDVDAVADLADLLVLQGRIDDAEKRIAPVIAQQPKYHRAKLTLGLIKLRRNELDAAETLLTEALMMNPDPVRAHYYLGQLYEKKGEHKSAMEHYREALKRCLHEE